jgi:beta-glucanase (GH16 family)
MRSLTAVLRAPSMFFVALSVTAVTSLASLTACGAADEAGPSDAAAASDAPPLPSDAGAVAPTRDGGAASDAGSIVPSDAAADAAADSSSLAGWTLTWSDEFNGADGTAIDTAKWNQETGNSGWSNNLERQYYTPGTANAVVQSGALVITAASQGASQYTCQYGACQYTSARFNTAKKFEQAYGRFEARIEIPRGQGLWPAFWMLGNNLGTAGVGWPQCGEVDIMENVGKAPATNYGSLHGPGYSGGQALSGKYALDAGALADSFHVFAVEWEVSVVRFYVDGVLYETRTPADVPAGHAWVYDHPFFVILNVAVGGNFPGDPDGTTHFPQTMKVDYVRVYKR